MRHAYPCDPLRVGFTAIAADERACAAHGERSRWADLVSGGNGDDHALNVRLGCSEPGFGASHYDGIALRTQIVPGERHAGVKPEAFNRALRLIFEPWAAQQAARVRLKAGRPHTKSQRSWAGRRRGGPAAGFADCPTRQRE
jgi:hypothetical protein